MTIEEINHRQDEWYRITDFLVDHSPEELIQEAHRRNAELDQLRGSE